MQTAGSDDHLGWAETLVDAGLYYQAQQQLDLLSEPDASSARANWLRAKLELVKLRNAAERHRRRLGSVPSESSLEEWSEKIKRWLDTATKQSPEFGPAWLTAAQVYLDPVCGQDFNRALQCAQRAAALLGETPEVLALGPPLRGGGSVSESITALRQSADSEEDARAKGKLELAELEARCQSEPVDVEAHLRLGRWCLQHEQRNRAHEIFSRLLDLRPDCAEGYYGLAWLAFTDFDKTATERLTEAHLLCREALKRNSDFGLAYELLGSIFRNVCFGMGTVEFPVEEPLDYYRRAKELDQTCDVALSFLAKEHIDRGELKPAIKLLERAAALDTKDSDVYSILAVIYKGTRQFEKEVWARRKAETLSPDTELSIEYQNKILVLCGLEY